LRQASSISPLIEFSLSCILFGILNAQTPHTKSFHFLSFHKLLYRRPWTDNTLNLQILILVASNLNRLHIYQSLNYYIIKKEVLHLSYDMKNTGLEL